MNKALMIAMVYHAALNALREANNDAPLKAWDEAEEWQRTSSVKQVEERIANPDAPLSAAHDSWYKERTEAGWKYGEVRDDANKINPALVPYDQLSDYDKSKDALHPMHVQYFNRCKRESDLLFTLIDSDQLVWSNKNKMPIINELDRAFMVDNLRAISGVLIINQIDELRVFLEKLVSLKGSSCIIRCFKNAALVYDKPLITVDGTENFIIPDVFRFSSTTEITTHLKTIK